MTKNTSEVSKESVQNCRRSCAYKVSSSKGGRKDGRKDGKMEGQKDGKMERQKLSPSAFLQKGGGHIM